MEHKKQTMHALIKLIYDAIEPTCPDTILAHQYSWWLLEKVTGQKKLSLLSQREIALTDSQQATLDQLIDQLVVEHKPLAYILGSVPFGDLNIIIEPPVLIPRPETEEWVFELATQLKTLDNQKLRILDLCTGSGCISLLLAHALPQSQVIGADIAEHAIELAQKNAHENKISNVSFIESDLFEKLSGKKFDLIVSNPPYIAYEEWRELDKSVSDWEDPRALIAEDDGLAVIKKIIEQSPDFIAQNPELEKKGIPNLLIEIGYSQGYDVTEFMKQQGLKSIVIDRDSAGKERVAKARVNYVALTSNTK